MFGRTGETNNNNNNPPWMVRAEVTIRHGTTPVTSATSASSASNSPGGVTSTLADSGGVRMVYRWNPTVGNETTDVQSPSYGFQRGNILFTSTPPSRPVRSFTIPRASANQFSSSRIGDSGYNSEQFSPQSYSSLPTRKPSQQYNRRCRSTCSIVLSTGRKKEDGKKEEESDNRPCKDPWCYHSRQGCGFKTVPETCEDGGNDGNVNNNDFRGNNNNAKNNNNGCKSAFTSHFCTVLTDKKNSSRDVASQTTDVESHESSSTATTVKRSRSRSSKVRRKGIPGYHQVEEQKNKDLSKTGSTAVDIKDCSTSTLDQEDRSERSEKSEKSEKSDSTASKDDSKKKSRTVHIDVYCTGSDDGSDSSSSDNERSTPMTVFENEEVRVTHSKVDEKIALPRNFQDDKAFLKRAAERRCSSLRHPPIRMPSLASSKGYESDDVLSSLYPSQFSSYSALRDLEEISVGSSKLAQFEEYDSTCTSWKDTFSDVESLLRTPCESLTPCDSFEYANLSDRERIDKMEDFIRTTTNGGKSWKSPEIERKHLLQNRRMKEFLRKQQIVGGCSSCESEACESDDSNTVAWSFVSPDEKSRSLVKRDSTVKRKSKDSEKTLEREVADLSKKFQPISSRTSSPFSSKVTSRVTSPFTTMDGEKTEHILKASKFGTVVNAFRKPGHHIGPSKNPSCSCEHCRRFFEEDLPAASRGRSKSLGEIDKRPGGRFEIIRGAIIRPAVGWRNK